jgi:hypothetical protein
VLTGAGIPSLACAGDPPLIRAGYRVLARGGTLVSIRAEVFHRAAADR